MTTQLPQMPPIPGIPITNNLIPAPGGGGISHQPETYTWTQLLTDSNIQQTTIPTADYDAQVTAATPGKTNGGKDKITVVFQLISGQFAGKTYDRDLTISNDSPKAMRVFFRQMKCLGCDDQFWLGEPSLATICERILNRQCRIQIKQREFPANSGLWENEVGFIREAIVGVNQGMPTMINQAPPMPQFAQPQQAYPQQFAQPVQAQQYAQPQQYPPAGQQFMTSSPAQPQPLQAAPISPYAQQVPPQQQPQVAQPVQQYPPPPQAQQNAAQQLQPAQNIPAGPEYAQAPQQYAPPPPPPQTPQFETMLRPPQEAAPQAQQLQPPPSPYQQPGQPQQAQEATPADAQPLPVQADADQVAAFQAFMAQQAQNQAQPQQQPPAPPLPREF
jgi:hypothetical protein